MDHGASRGGDMQSVPDCRLRAHPRLVGSDREGFRASPSHEAKTPTGEWPAELSLRQPIIHYALDRVSAWERSSGVRSVSM